MASYSFIQGIPGDRSLGFETTLFHEPDHLKLQAVGAWVSFYMLDQHGAATGLIHFYLENNSAKSEMRSPYGSFVFDTIPSDEAINGFIEFICNHLKQLGILEIQIKGFPGFLFEEQIQAIHQSLTSSSFEVTNTEQSTALLVDEKMLEEKLNRSHFRKLTKCRDAAFRFKELELDQLKRVFDFIKECRASKAYELSMSYEEIAALATVFPKRIYLFAVFDNDKMIAASLCIVERSDVLYDFYHDHDQNYDEYSPVVLLVEGMYRICQERKIRIINLGTSMHGNEVNESLLVFKQRLGGKLYSKYTYLKHIS